MATPRTQTSTIAKPKRPQVPPYKRCADQLKRLAMQGKLSSDELQKIEALAKGLQSFVEA
jgi:hypothetical protein